MMQAGKWVRGSAVFSRCGRYRYVLRREWDSSRDAVLFIGLNPSTADARRDDPTIRRCIGFARSWGYGAVIVANLFAFRATDPAKLKVAGDPVGPRNDRWLARLRGEAGMTVAAWGVHGKLRSRDEEFLAEGGELYCLGRTKGGCPRHPLYLRGDAGVVRFAPRAMVRCKTRGASPAAKGKSRRWKSVAG